MTMELDSKRAHRTLLTLGHFSALLEGRHLLRSRHLLLRHLHLHRHLHLRHLTAMLETAWPALQVRCALGISVALTEAPAHQQTTPSRDVPGQSHLTARLQELWFELSVQSKFE